MKDSFKYAFRGIAAALGERNFRFHLAVTFYVLIAAFITRLTRGEWLAILLCIGAVTSAELFNTSIEKLCDALRPEWDKRIGLVKDLTAGAVLLLALVSAAVGAVIFFNAEKVGLMLDFIKGSIAVSAILFATLPLAGYLIFRRYKYDHKDSHDHDRGSSERR